MTLQKCPNCGADIVGKVDYCPHCNHDLTAKPPEHTPKDDEALQALEQTAPSFENAPTINVDPKLIGASAPDTESDDYSNQIDEAASTPPPEPKDEPAYAPASQMALEPLRPQLDAIPPAPYTPPPLREQTVSTEPYSYPSNYYMEQRLAAYRQGGYQLINYSPYQATLAYGKPIGFFWWILAALSGIGFFWYFIIMMSSGFSKDRVYLIVERDGTLYEDGAGAAHVRRQRSRVGRRWGFLGVIIFFVCLLWFIGLVTLSVVGINEYRAELSAAYPEVEVFTERDENVSVNADDIATAESAVLAISVLFAISTLGILSGLALIVVGYLHNAAYDVRVLPLPSAT